MFDPASTSIKPPRKLGEAGLFLWDFIQSEYRIDDHGGIELLMQCCECSDRIVRLGERITADGEIIETKAGPKVHPAIKEELAGRQFICRTLERLGLNLEAIKPEGRPSTAWKGPPKDRDNGHD